MSKKPETVNLTPGTARYAIVTDWFSAILSASDPVVNFGEALDLYEFDRGRIALKKLEFGAPMFKHHYEVIIKKKPYARIHVSPTSEAIFRENEMQFELLNNVHYEIGWCDDLRYLFKTLRWKVENVSRLDIALDGTDAGFMSIMKKLFQGQIEKTGKTKIQFFTNSKIQLEGCDIGKRSSDKWVTCYIKSDELEKSNKQYIRKFWDRTGLKGEYVERLELKLRNESIRMIKDFFNDDGECVGWQYLDNFEFIASIFRTFIEGGDMINHDTGEVKESRGIIDFVVADEQKNISRKKRVRFINWDYIGGQKLERLSTKQSNEIYRMKLSCKTLVWIYLQTKEDHYLHIAREIAVNINCLKWMADKFQSWCDEFDKKTFDYLPKYKQGYANKQLMLYEIPGVTV